MARLRAGNDFLGVDGLKELSDSLKQLDPVMARELRRTNKSVASHVADAARSAAFAQGSTAAHVAPSIKATASTDFAAVAGGGSGYEMFGGAEFGAGQNKPRQRSSGEYLGYNQFNPWAGGGKGSDAGGYFLWPTIRRELPNIDSAYLAALGRIIKEAGLA